MWEKSLEEVCQVRLIDADALNVKQWFASTDNRKRMAEALDAAPTIDAEPVRHGRWIVDDLGHTYCSECKTRLPFLHCYTDEPNSDYDEEWDEEIPETHYCPNCGAKLDGGDPHD